MNAILFPIAFGAGIGIALQATLNGQLARGIGGDPLTASLVSFVIGALFLTRPAGATHRVDDVAGTGRRRPADVIDDDR